MANSPKLAKLLARTPAKGDFPDGTIRQHTLPYQHAEKLARLIAVIMKEKECGLVDALCGLIDYCGDGLPEIKNVESEAVQRAWNSLYRGAGGESAKSRKAKAKMEPVGAGAGN